MRSTIKKIVVVLFIALFPLSSYSGTCDNTSSSEDVAYCLGTELRDSDSKINELYKELMNKLEKEKKEQLRKDQRAWLKERDSECNCSSKESDREKWFQDLLKDYRKTVCVTRFTRFRTSELDQMLATISKDSRNGDIQSKHPLPALEEHKYLRADYQYLSSLRKTDGRWYYEITLKCGDIAGFSPTALWIGCVDEKTNNTFGHLSQIRGSDLSAPVVRFGFALDLEAGKLYTRVNGAWQQGYPGSSGGLDLKIGHPHRFKIESTALINPLVEKKYIQINIGDKPFEYSMPDGYRPYDE